MWQVERTAHAKVCSMSAQGRGWGEAGRGGGAMQGAGDQGMWCPGDVQGTEQSS